MILIQFFTQTLKLVIIILNISYYVGIFWYIYCDIIRRIMEAERRAEGIHD